MTTFKQIWLNGRKAKVNGQVWDVTDISVDGREAILVRTIRVKSHFRRMGEYHASGFRMISIRRPVESLAEAI